MAEVSIELCNSKSYRPLDVLVVVSCKAIIAYYLSGFVFSVKIYDDESGILVAEQSLTGKLCFITIIKEL